MASAATETSAATVPATVAVELAYARPDRQWLLALTVPQGATVAAVIQQSGLLERCPELDLAVNPVGIWSRPVALDQTVQAGDRVEIYRPLRLDPNATLRQRAWAKQRRQR
ncbi:MAG: RnfH family protein [Permianibacter sp.]